MLAVRAEPAAPHIDGVLDDAVWQQAPRFGGFTQRIPDEGQPATDSTAVQFAYDDEALYAAIMCYDPEPDKIVARLSRRDRGIFTSDWVHLSIDSNHDRQTAYSFFVSAAGTLMDGYYYNDDWEDETWDGVWDVRTHIGPQGWSAEFRIPFSVLRFTPQEEHVMGLNVDRYVLRKREDAFWTYIPRSAKGWVSRFGELRGIRGISPPQSREVLPYAVGRSTFSPKSPTDRDGRDHFGSLGLDVRYGVTSHISLNATVNPDFGQVEADPAVLNLTVFETFYEERRPFFVEGAQLFQTPFQLFYSRRIGRVPDRLPLTAGYQVADRPEFTSILGAAKVTGKTAGKTSFGLMEAVTAPEHASLVPQGAGPGGPRRERLLEPGTSYLVGRLRQDPWRGNSNIGVIGTAVNRSRSGSAYTGGADWDLYWHDNAYQFTGQIAGSRTGGFGTARSGLAARAEVGRRSGTLQGFLRYDTISPQFDANDLGYSSRADKHVAVGRVQLRYFGNTAVFRRRTFSVIGQSSWNYEGIHTQQTLETGASLELRSFWWVYAWLTRQFRTLDDLDTRGGLLIQRPASTGVWLAIDGDERKVVSTNLGYDGERDEHGSTWQSARVELQARPSTRVELSVAPTYSWSDDDAQWVTNVDQDGDGRPDHFVYARLRSRVLELTSRFHVVFTPRLSFQLYAQPFVAVGRYHGFKEPARPRGYAFTPYTGPSVSPDFRRRSLRANAVLRWEYRLGSTLFLVWSQSRQDTGADSELRPWRNLRHTFTDNGANTFMAKLSYWANL
ncbi:MAG: DUF5916 domain-containing protein [Candidatus Latescibacterota bacterium]